MPQWAKKSYGARVWKKLFCKHRVREPSGEETVRKRMETALSWPSVVAEVPSPRIRRGRREQSGGVWSKTAHSRRERLRGLRLAYSIRRKKKCSRTVVESRSEAWRLGGESWSGRGWSWSLGKRQGGVTKAEGDTNSDDESLML